MYMQTMHRIIVSGSVMIALLSSVSSASVMTVKPLTVSGGMSVAAHVLAHPPVVGECSSCHPDVKTMPGTN